MREVIAIAQTRASLPAKRQILTVCVKLFLEKGYRKTTLAEIIEKADVSYSSFQNIFRAKDGILTELVEFMFSNQFAMARSAAGAKWPPVYVYAIETAIQLTLTELNENLREIYIEAYTQKEAYEYILRETAKELYQIFGSYQPDLTPDDFYQMGIGSGNVMRGYMAHPCDETLTLEKKIRLFLNMTLRTYNVPADEREQTIRFVEGLDIRAISERVMQKLFEALAVRYDFSLQEVEQVLYAGAKTPNEETRRSGHRARSEERGCFYLLYRRRFQHRRPPGTIHRRRSRSLFAENHANGAVLNIRDSFTLE